MHDGSLASLREVIEFYNRGGQANPALDSLIKPLGLTPAEIDDLMAFLQTLNGRFELEPRRDTVAEPPFVEAAVSDLENK